MRYEPPKVIDHGSIIAHTFSRCAGATGEEGSIPPKDWQDFPLDKHGECSAGHAS
jgi:hypothetical protein